MPELYRFISPDKIDYLEEQNINGLNLYCYCKNDPTNNIDYNGNITLSFVLIFVLSSLITYTAIATEPKVKLFEDNVEVERPVLTLDKPNINKEGVSLGSFSFVSAKKKWFLNSKHNNYIYVTSFKASAGLELNYKEKDLKCKFGINSFSIGIKIGKIDLNVGLGTKGFDYDYSIG
jgi:hypothetical protein